MNNFTCKYNIYTCTCIYTNTSNLHVNTHWGLHVCAFLLTQNTLYMYSIIHYSYPTIHIHVCWDTSWILSHILIWISHKWSAIYIVSWTFTLVQKIMYQHHNFYSVTQGKNAQVTISNFQNCLHMKVAICSMEWNIHVQCRYMYVLQSIELRLGALHSVTCTPSHKPLRVAEVRSHTTVRYSYKFTSTLLHMWYYMYMYMYIHV